jgi:hypothetical protein
MLERVVGADTKVTLLLEAGVAKYIRITSAEQGKTQSKFATDVLERYSRVERLDEVKLRLLLQEIAGHKHQGISGMDYAIATIYSIFGIEKGE